MDKDQALNEVKAIKQVMENSSKWSSRGKYWIGVLLTLLALVATGLIPFLAPIMGVGLLVGGIIAWRLASDSVMKSIAGGIIAVGIVLILLTVFVVTGLIGYSTSTTTTTVTIAPPVP